MTEEENKNEKEDKKNENKSLELEPCRPKTICDWECYKDTGDC